MLSPTLLRRLRRGLLVVSAVALASGSALADDWVAERLRGGVFALEDGQWVQLRRGDVVPDNRPIQTASDGRVTFTRGKERLDLSPGTQVQILDAGKGALPYTTVRQYFGEVGVEAEVRDVEHFAVETPYLAAVVKGTRFSVETGDEVSRVEVERGNVSVSDNDSGETTSVDAGQSAAVGPELGEIITQAVVAPSTGGADAPSLSAGGGGSAASSEADPEVALPDEDAAEPDDQPEAEPEQPSSQPTSPVTSDSPGKNRGGRGGKGNHYGWGKWLKDHWDD
jgi:hypothetical protein